MGSYDSWATSGIDDEKFTFRWNLKLDDIEEDPNIQGETSWRVEVESPEFYGGRKSRHRWYLELTTMTTAKIIDGVYVEDQHNELFLHLDAFGDESSVLPVEERFIKLSCKTTVMNQNSLPLEVNEIRYEVPLELHTSFEGPLCRWDEKVSQLVRLNGDYLQIYCEFTIHGDMKHESGSTSEDFPSLNEHKDFVLNDLKSLISSALFSDVELCTEDTPSSQKFKAHKNILACRSPVFSRMFQANMLESVTNTVVITDFKDNVVEAMLLHVYGGTSDNFVELAPELLQIADKYELTSLKAQCEAAIAPSVNLDNALTIFQMAKAHNAPKLKRAATNFINK